MRLVADIGGTNARVALCADGVIDQSTTQRFSNADWYSLNDILRAYCEAHLDAVINDMVIAVAGPVHAGRATLTNRNWTINADKMAQLFSCNRVILLALVVGIGTGFNISQVITKDQCTVCPPAEAGHISMPSAISSELEARACNPDQFPEAAIKSYGDPDQSKVTSAIDTYAGLLGLLLRDFSLSYMPSHGMFLAGSVGRAIASCAPEPLINVLHEPCNFRLQRNPSIFVAEEDDAALIGCAQF